MSIFSKKYCSYKNCKSNNIDPLCTETFFAFPKDREKYKLWVMLSRCSNQNLNKNQTKSKYLCSKHFDHEKYLSLNPRRKLLLSNAIPYKYESDNDNNDDDDDDDGDDDGGNCVNDGNHNNENLNNNNKSEDEYEELEILHVLENSDDIDELQAQEELNYIKISDNDNVEYLENELSNSPKNNYPSSPVIFLERNSIKIENQQSPQQLNNDDDDDDDDQRYYHQQINDNKRRKLNEIKFSSRKKPKLIPNNCDDDDNPQISTTIEEREDILCMENEDEEQEEDYSNKNNDNNNFRIRIQKSKNYLNTNENYVHKVTNNNDGNDDNNDGDDDDVNNLITNPFIITFIHKNEEYIKMPKSIYCKEKRKLLNEIKYYKDVIINFRKQLMNVRM